MSVSPFPVLPHRKTLSTPTFTGHVGIAEAKLSGQALVDEVDGGAGNQAHGFFRYHHFQTLTFENTVVCFSLTGNANIVGPAGAAGTAHVNAQANTSFASHELTNSGSRRLGQLDT